MSIAIPGTAERGRSPGKGMTACRQEGPALLEQGKIGRARRPHRRPTRPTSTNGRENPSRGDFPISAPCRAPACPGPGLLLATRRGDCGRRRRRQSDHLPQDYSDAPSPSPTRPPSWSGAATQSSPSTPPSASELARAGARSAPSPPSRRARGGLDDVQNFALIVDCSGQHEGEPSPTAAPRWTPPRRSSPSRGARTPRRAERQPDARRPRRGGEMQGGGGEAAADRYRLGREEELMQAVAEPGAAGAHADRGGVCAAGGTLEGAKGLSQVVLVTDGMETCHEDPAAVAEAITLKYKPPRVEVVGLGLKAEEKPAVTRIARRGREVLRCADGGGAGPMAAGPSCLPTRTPCRTSRQEMSRKRKPNCRRGFKCWWRRWRTRTWMSGAGRPKASARWASGPRGRSRGWSSWPPAGRGAQRVQSDSGQGRRGGRPEEAGPREGRAGLARRQQDQEPRRQAMGQPLAHRVGRGNRYPAEGRIERRQGRCPAAAVHQGDGGGVGGQGPGCPAGRPKASARWASGPRGRSRAVKLASSGQGELNAFNQILDKDAAVVALKKRAPRRSSRPCSPPAGPGTQT